MKRKVSSQPPAFLLTYLYVIRKIRENTEETLSSILYIMDDRRSFKYFKPYKESIILIGKNQ